MVSPIFSWRFSISSLFPSGRICGVIAATSCAQAVCQYRSALSSHRSLHTLELRLDYLRNDRERLRLFAWLSRRRRMPTRPRIPAQRHKPILIATCRTLQGGGNFNGTVDAQIEILRQAVEAGCDWCDLEIESADRILPEVLRRKLSPARLLISAHDFKKVPRDLSVLVGRLTSRGGHALKVAAVCRSQRDVLRLIQVARAYRNAVVIPMGEEVLGARILALREGSALTYAAASETTAPGQISLDSAFHVYFLNRPFGPAVAGPTRRTRVYGVIGHPVAHSLSPAMHNAAFAARRVNALYLPFEVRGLGDFLRSVVPLGISGFSVTLPHKQRILRYLDGCDRLAAAIGAVNTVIVRGTRLYGYNTDYAGVLRAMESHVSLRSSRVLLLGAGGAARAATFALAGRGAEVAICSRRPVRARALARAVRFEAPGVRALDRSALRHETFDAIVNCTPVGLYPGSGSPLEPAELRCRLVMDMIYRPRVTPLLRLAAHRGIATISGVDMFLAQGAAQYEIWTGERAPEAAMRKAVLEALQHEEREAQASSKPKSKQ